MSSQEVKSYKNEKEFRKEQPKIQKKGYRVVSVTNEGRGNIRVARGSGGGAVGAAVGSIVPGVGTAIGGLVGGLAAGKSKKGKIIVVYEKG